jgi:L-fuculose-phosphate aldolase
VRSVPEARQAVLECAKQLAVRGLVEGTAGNVSARMADGNVCITPSSVDYDSMTLEDLVVVTPDGQVVDGTRSPSSERLLHLACYRAFEEVGAVIHSHPVYASMFAVARRPVPACIDEFTIYVGGDVPVARYAQSGSEAIGAAAVEALADRAAVLLANHGMVAVGKDPADALHVTALVERGARIALGATLLGGIIPLPEQVTTDFAAVYRLLRTS